jgi:hypothetical protein
MGKQLPSRQTSPLWAKEPLSTAKLQKNARITRHAVGEISIPITDYLLPASNRKTLSESPICWYIVFGGLRFMQLV